MRITNLTGHALALESGRETIRLKSEGRARVRSASKTSHFIEVGGIRVPVLIITEQEIVDLPSPSPGQIYIVSGIVSAAADRGDVLSPGRLHRSVGGRVETARALVRLEALRGRR